MARFKIGDKVKIDCPYSEMHNRTGRVWEINRWPRTYWGEASFSHDPKITRFSTAYRIDVDGVGRLWPGEFAYIAYPHWMLKPILPDKLADKFIERIKRMEREPIPQEVLNGTTKVDS